VETPAGRVRVRARLNEDVDPRVAMGEHGWWQTCAALGAPGYDPFGPDRANFNNLVDTAPLMADLRPIAAVQTSGTVAQKRSFVGAVANGWDRPPSLCERRILGWRSKVECGR